MQNFAADLIEDFGKGKIRLSASRFADVVKNYSKNASFENWQIDGNNLQQFDFTDRRFFSCQFASISFGRLLGVTFASCTFRDCSFESPDFETETLEKVLYFESTLQDCTFNRAKIKSTNFVDCKILGSFTFDECAVLDRITFESAGNYDQLKGLSKLRFLENASLRITNTKEVSDSKLNWEHIKFAAKIPILQASLFGISLLAILAVILNLINQTLLLAKADCLVALSNTARVERFSICEFSNFTNLITASNKSYFVYLASFCIFVAASLIQLTYCPQEVLDFTKAQWVRDLKLPEQQYSIISSIQTRLCWLAAILYAIGTAIFVYAFGERILNLISLAPV